MKSALLLLSLLAAAPASAASLAGLWEFQNSGNLGQASVGNNLTFSGTAPVWSATLADDASNSLSGVVTTPANVSSNMMSVTHGIAANGGGLMVNQWSILVDIHSPAGSRGNWRTIFQTEPANNDDGEYFIRPNNDWIGTAQLTYSGAPIDETAWTRLVVTFDGPATVRAYVNGTLFYTHTNDDPLIDDRYALRSQMHFFSDDDGDNAPMNVGAIALWDGALSAGEVSALGLAGAAIPEPGTASLLTGLSVVLLAARRRRH